MTIDNEEDYAQELIPGQMPDDILLQNDLEGYCEWLRETERFYLFHIQSNDWAEFANRLLSYMPPNASIRQCGRIHLHDPLPIVYVEKQYVPPLFLAKSLGLPVGAIREAVDIQLREIAPPAAEPTVNYFGTA